MKQKHFIDIQNIREEDTELRENNVRGFVPGDIIQITEKYDGYLMLLTVLHQGHIQVLKMAPRLIIY